ncbi:hypothetical protein HYC85_018675 [Camellia sinensis]|uniref:Uncharacterized protein n=1 Tax=Camellia sinensis TaxID=4442 RepID=A0A7J7GYU0_CAMSI|nr:hypothetical protein HYC85_018675 [Camellia sinensis]
MIIYNMIFMSFLVLLVIAIDAHNPILLFFSMAMIFILFFVVHHLASVVSMLKSIFEFEVMKKSYKLLKGTIQMAVVLIFGYLAIYEVIKEVFGAVVVHGEVFGWGYGDCEFDGFDGAKAITTRRLTRVLDMIISEAILESMCPSKATFKWRTWMFQAMIHREKVPATPLTSEGSKRWTRI